MTGHDSHPGGVAAVCAQPPASRIILVGPMGAGKTTIGRQLAAMLAMDFCDSDQEIESRTGTSIPIIFEIEGEQGFRRRESAMIAELMARPNLVLATGGGAVLSEENRRALREGGAVVYLRAATDILVERTRRDRCRPLLQTGNPRGRIEELMRVRDPLYRSTAHVIVDTDRRSPAAVARDVIAKLKPGD